MRRGWSGIAVLLCSCLVVLSTGCSLINPHVKWTPPGGKTLDDAIAYANGAKEAYRTAVGDQAVLTNSLAIALFPVGALGIGLATHPGNADTILALGLGGAAAYGMGSWLSSKPRQLVYLNGIKAMDCAIKAMLPLRLPADQETRFNDELKNLDESITAVTDKIIEVTDLVDKVPSQDPNRQNVTKAATEELGTARNTLKEASGVYASGIKLVLERGRAGHNLIVAVDDIGVEVDRAIVATLPDLQALPGIVSGLAQTSSQFTKVGAPKGADLLAGKAPEEVISKQGAPTAQTMKLNLEMGKLKGMVMKLQNHAGYIALVVNSVREAAQDTTGLKQCGVEAVPVGLNAEPTGVQFQEGKSGSRRILVSGGKQPYMAEIEDAPIEGLAVTSAPPWVILQATDKVAAGSYTLLVTDVALNTKAVRVTVAGGTQSGKPAEAAKPEAPKQKLASPTADETKTIALALCLPDTEKLGSDKMTDAVKIFQDTVNPGEKVKVTGQLTQDEMNSLMGLPRCKGDRKNYYENEMTVLKIKELQKALKVKPETGQFDQATRRAIQNFAADKGLKPSDGTLTDEIANKIGGQDAPATP